MNSKSINLYIICIILLIIDGAHSLFSFVFMPGYRTLLGLLTMFLFLIIYPSRKKVTITSIILYVFLVIGAIISQRGNVAFSFMAKLPVLTLFMLNREDLKFVAYRIEKFFFIIITISFTLYILTNILNISLPFEKVIYKQYTLNNYFYLYTNSLNYGIKFTGFTVEPGYISVLCICLLSLNQFRFTKISSFVYTIAILFSLSLEGYLLLIMGIILSTICREGKVSKTIKYTILVIILLSVSIYIAMNYNNGNNVVAEYIMDRLVYDEETGIVGNNRESIMAEMVVDNVFYSDQVWFGIGEEAYLKMIEGLDICSWRSFILMYGAIYSIILLLLTIIGFSQTVLRNTLPFFILYWMDFMPHGGPFYEVMYFLLIIFLLNQKKDQLFKPL